MVRLRQRPRSLPPMMDLFTIHYGEIKTNMSSASAVSVVSNLQSTMVRLRRFYQTRLQRSIRDLQSTMVRLRPKGRHAYAEVESFTIHYGEIKTENHK